MDWAEKHKEWISQERHPGWPEGVRTISISGLDFLGVHERTGSLYWDGQPIEIKRRLDLRWYELLLAVLAAVGTFGTFLVELCQALATG